jgi:hypothetical protein
MQVGEIGGTHFGAGLQRSGAMPLGEPKECDAAERQPHRAWQGNDLSGHVEPEVGIVDFAARVRHLEPCRPQEESAQSEGAGASQPADLRRILRRCQRVERGAAVRAKDRTACLRPAAAAE